MSVLDDRQASVFTPSNTISLACSILPGGGGGGGGGCCMFRAGAMTAQLCG